MSRDDLIANNAGIVGAWSKAAAAVSPGRDPDRRHQPARRDVPRRQGRRRASRASASWAWPASSTRPGSGRSSPRSSACRWRTSTRSSSAATATRWCRCRATRRSPACRSPSSCPPDRVKALEERTANGGAEVVAPAQDRLGVLRPRRVDVRDGRRDPPRPEARPALRRAAPGRVRVDGLFVGVPVVLGRGGLERVFEIELTRRRAGGVRQVRGRGPGAGRQALR